MDHPMNSANSDFRTQAFRDRESREHDFRTYTQNGQSRNGCPAENADFFPALHNLVLAEVFRAHPETLTITELFQRTHGQFTASGLLNFTRAVVRLEEEGLLEPVFPQESSEDCAGTHGVRLTGSSNAEDAAEGGCAPQVSSSQVSCSRSESADLDAEHLPSLMEQLFPEIFGTAKRLADVCQCGELAHRTCPCGARTCHNHFYDGDGNLARRDHNGFCGECVDLIREEAAGIERYGRTQ